MLFQMCMYTNMFTQCIYAARYVRTYVMILQLFAKQTHVYIIFIKFIYVEQYTT